MNRKCDENIEGIILLCRIMWKIERHPNLSNKMPSDADIFYFDPLMSSQYLVYYFGMTEKYVASIIIREKR